MNFRQVHLDFHTSEKIAGIGSKFDKKQLQQMANQAATLLQTGIYGGDCIIQPDGTPVLIDFNDWPSFSRCRTEAAQAIAEHIVQKAGLQTIKKGNDRTDKHA